MRARRSTGALSHDEVVLAARIIVGFSSQYRLIAQTELRGRLETVLAQLDAAAQPALVASASQKLSVVTVGSRKIEAAQRAVELGEAA